MTVCAVAGGYTPALIRRGEDDPAPAALVAQIWSRLEG